MGRDKQLQTLVNRMLVLHVLFLLLIIVAAWFTEKFTVWFGLLALVMIVEAVVIFRQLPKLLKRQAEGFEETHQKSALKLLAHYRHDVMNQVQLIKGYLQLNKMERLAGPIQELVEHSRRHSSYSNFPGRFLPYFLIDHDLTVPEIHLYVEIDETITYLDSVCEAHLLTLLQQTMNLGQQLGQEFGVAADWKLQITQNDNKLAINLHVSGEHVNDTYIQKLVQMTRAFDWVMQLPEAATTGNQVILQNGKLGEFQCL